MAEQVPVVGNILSLIERRDWERLGRHLDKDVHWTTSVEEHLHGRDDVVAVLKTDPPPGPPSFHEVRAGLLVRWIDKPG